MNKFFVILNWSLLAFVLAVRFLLVPMLHSSWILVGAAMSAMFFGGYSSWRYYKDPDPRKNRQWRNAYFNKNYARELWVQLLWALVFATLAWCLAPILYIMAGFAVTLAFNYIIEWLYARFTHKHPPI